MKSNLYAVLFTSVTVLSCSIIGMENDEAVTLHGAAAKGNLESVKSLLDESQKNEGQSWTTWLFGGVRIIDEQNSGGQTALHCAALVGHDKVVTLLLDRGAQIDLQDNNKQTALHCAALAGHDEVVVLLLDKKAQVDVQDSNGDTPLYCAAQNTEVEVARLLLEGGARADMFRAFTLLLKQQVGCDSDDAIGKKGEVLSDQRPLLGVFSQEEIKKMLRKLKSVSERELKPKEEVLTFEQELQKGFKSLKSASERQLPSKEQKLMERQIAMQEKKS